MCNSYILYVLVVFGKGLFKCIFVNIRVWCDACNVYLEGLLQDYSNSIANALELLQSHTKPSICLQSTHQFTFRCLYHACWWLGKHRAKSISKFGTDVLGSVFMLVKWWQNLYVCIEMGQVNNQRIFTVCKIHILCLPFIYVFSLCHEFELHEFSLICFSSNHF